VTDVLDGELVVSAIARAPSARPSTTTSTCATPARSTPWSRSGTGDRLRRGQRRHRPPRPARGAERRALGRHARRRPEVRDAGVPRRGAGHAPGRPRQHVRRVVDHGCGLRLGRARAVLGGQGRDGRPGPRAGGRAGRRRRARERDRPGLHPHRAVAVGGALARRGGTGGGRAVHPDGARGRPRGRRRRGRLLGLRRRARYLTGQTIVVDGGLLVGRTEISSRGAT
jgi:hypothetical protein